MNNKKALGKKCNIQKSRRWYTEGDILNKIIPLEKEKTNFKKAR